MTMDAQVKVRKMLPEDYPEIYALWRACPEMELNDVDDSEAGILRLLARNPDTCFVAEVEGHLAGVILVGCDGRRGYVYHAGVLPALRGRGVGSALVEEAMRVLREMGICKVGLLVFASNELGKRFWASHGFDARDDLAYMSRVLREVKRVQ